MFPLLALLAAAAPLPQGTVVELFTAQGCPACPAADAAQAAVAARRGVIALTLPVTYWDARGWRDPLAQEAFTQRQHRYAAIGRREAATPQFVVDGRYATNAAATLDAAIRTGARVGGPAIARRGGRLLIGADARTARAATVWVADYHPRPIRTAIRAGATRGRTAVQVNVVARLRAIGRWHGAATGYRLPPPLPGMARAAFVQGDEGGAIVAAAVLA